MSDEKTTPDPIADARAVIADARAVIAADRERRERECLAELQALLTRHRCALMPTIHGQPAPPSFVQLTVVAQE